MSTESVVQVELIRKERRFLGSAERRKQLQIERHVRQIWKVLLFQRERRLRRVNWKTASSGTGDFSWRASSVIFTDCARAERRVRCSCDAAAALQMAYDKTRPA